MQESKIYVCNIRTKTGKNQRNNGLRPVKKKADAARSRRVNFFFQFLQKVPTPISDVLEEESSNHVYN